MNWKLLTLGLLIWVFIPWDGFSQKKLTKSEILDECRKLRSVPIIDSVFRWDIQSVTRQLLDELLVSGVDTLVIYSVSFPGFARLGKKDSCSAMYPIYSYFFLKKKGEYFQRKADGSCKSGVINANRKVIRFAVENYEKIDDEFFMGAISGAEKKGERLRISERWIDHEPKYSMLVVVHNQHNYLEFTECDLACEESLFLDYNKGLTSYHLFELIRSEVDK